MKASAYNVGDLGSIPGLRTSPGEGNGNPLQYSCLENPMEREAWQAIVHGVAKSRTRLSDFTSLHFFTSLKLKGHLSGPGKLSVGLESPEHHRNEKWAFREFVLTRTLWMKHQDLAGPEY